MIDSSKKRNSLVGVEVLSPYVIERRSKEASPKDARAERRRRRQRERHKTIGLISKNNRSARAFYVLYISLPFSLKQQREMTKFKVLWRT